MSDGLRRITQARPPVPTEGQALVAPHLMRQADGSFQGQLYVAINGMPMGHLELMVAGPKPMALRALAEALMEYVRQAESTIWTPG